MKIEADTASKTMANFGDLKVGDTFRGLSDDETVLGVKVSRFNNGRILPNGVSWAYNALELGTGEMLYIPTNNVVYVPFEVVCKVKWETPI